MCNVHSDRSRGKKKTTKKQRNIVYYNRITGAREKLHIRVPLISSNLLVLLFYDQITREKKNKSQKVSKHIFHSNSMYVLVLEFIYMKDLTPALFLSFKIIKNTEKFG